VSTLKFAKAPMFSTYQRESKNGKKLHPSIEKTKLYNQCFVHCESTNAWLENYICIQIKVTS
jgi:hypothetical protein